MTNKIDDVAWRWFGKVPTFRRINQLAETPFCLKCNRFISGKEFKMCLKCGLLSATALCACEIEVQRDFDAKADAVMWGE